ncbi:MAG TPA: ribonuclease III [Bauldia sp.]|nr:ribonuclease III [Bauldia sp.]
MKAGADAALAALERRLGHRFQDLRLLATALTHASATSHAGATYQRLEFLGDRVLALVVAEMLIATFRGASEGELAQRLTALVRNEACADVARALDLGAALRLGTGEVLSGGRTKAAILGDVCEAVIGAIYQDGGLDAARRLIETHWHGRMLGEASVPRDAKTTLQEWAQGRGLPVPAYAIVARSGPDHAPRFEVEASVDGLAPARGEGRTRREAEQAAAAAALARLGLWKVAEAG